MTINRKNAAIYIFQMNDGRWHICANDRIPATCTAVAMELYAAGLDRGFDTEREARTALTNWRNA